MLESLDLHYEDEKEALLAALHDQDQRFQSERHRQLELARLRRDAKVMQQEEKFDSVAILLSMAEKHERTLEAKYVQSMRKYVLVIVEGSKFVNRQSLSTNNEKSRVGLH